MSLPDGFAHSFTIETYALYGVGIAIIVIRLIERTRRAKGIRNLQIEDWIAFQLIGWFTLLTVAINKVIKGGGSNFMTPEEQAALAPETTRERVIGSKYVLVSEFGMLFTIWSCKLIILLVYRRLTLGLKQERYILAVSIWVGIGFTATLLALFLSCRPFSAYWSVPASNPQCWSYYHFGYVEAVFNISADLARPWQQKVPLVIVFGMGLFVIAAAITNKMYAYLPWLLSYDYAFWYMREAAVSVYVTNLPALWSILREIFPSLQTWGYTGTANSKGQSNASERKGSVFELKGFRKYGSPDLDPEKSPSQEHIMRNARLDSVSEAGWSGNKAQQVTIEEDQVGVYVEDTLQPPASTMEGSAAHDRGKSRVFITD